MCIVCAGRYLLVRDPNKPQLRLYSVPPGAVEVGAAAELSDGEEDDVEMDE